jgi:hypothetical protein
MVEQSMTEEGMINVGRHSIGQMAGKTNNSEVYFLTLMENGNPHAVGFDTPEEAEQVARELLRRAVGWKEGLAKLKGAPAIMAISMTPQRAAVLAVLQQAKQPLRLMEIAAALEAKPNNVAMTLYRMQSDGQADYVTVGPYRRWYALPRTTSHHTSFSI